MQRMTDDDSVLRCCKSLFVAVLAIFNSRLSWMGLFVGGQVEGGATLVTGCVKMLYQNYDCYLYRSLFMRIFLAVCFMRKNTGSISTWKYIEMVKSRNLCSKIYLMNNTLSKNSDDSHTVFIFEHILLLLVLFLQFECWTYEIMSTSTHKVIAKLL